jgi:hypothetical protein
VQAVTVPNSDGPRDGTVFLITFDETVAAREAAAT